jgi:hypothetical protein
MIVKRFLNFVNEQDTNKIAPTTDKMSAPVGIKKNKDVKTTPSQTKEGPDGEEVDEAGKKVLDADQKPVLYFRKRNPAYWDVEQQWEKLKGYQPKFVDKLPTPNIGGHHKVIVIGKSGSSSDSSTISMSLSSKKEKVFQVYLTNPANTTSKEYLDEPEENEIKEMLKSVGMTGVGMEIQERGNNWGFVIVYGAYERADQVFKAIDKIGLKFGHFIYFDNGKTLSPAPGTKPPETGTQGEIVKAVTK